jgi:hypothetical protein
MSGVLGGRRVSEKLVLPVACVFVFAVLLTGIVGVVPARANSPWWHLTSGARPTNLERETTGEIAATATNLGDAETKGTVTIADTLPAGFKAVSISAQASGVGTPVKCVLASLTCTLAAAVPPYSQIELRIGVEVAAGAQSGEENVVSISGGEAPGATLTRAIGIGEATPFGVENYELTPEEEGGGVDTQAGSHPFQLTTMFALNQTLNGAGEPVPVALAKDSRFKWPAGLIGNPTPIPRCTLGQFLAFTGQETVNACPPQSAVGVAVITIHEPALKTGAYTFTVAVFNLEPGVGEPAKFGFLLPGVPVFLDPSVRTGEDYGITVDVDNITQEVGFFSSVVTIWGVPGDPRHDEQRGTGCLRDARHEAEHFPCNPLGDQHPSSFLELPASCSGTPLQTSVDVDSWTQPGVFGSFAANESLPRLDGCNRLPFNPSINVTPDGNAGSTPTGLTADVHVPQAESLNPNGLAEGEPRNITVALPEGLVLNPGAADGLSSCSEAQIGFLGVDPQSGQDRFTPDDPACPDASKVANATIKTPLLANPLEGAVYLASPQNFTGALPENPFESLVAMYLVAKDPVSGVLIKLAGRVTLSETGQITATFKNSPQAPFEDAELKFFGGDRAPLATPARCGGYVANATFTAWSSEESIAASSPPFEITSGPNKTACQSPLPFAPSLTAGTTSIQAGGFSPFTTTMSREDGQQNLKAITLHMPPGISGLLSSVKLCPEAQANAGACGPESEIGETIVSVGLGGDPFSVTGGKVFITTGYEGAPYGLSVVNPAKAGPFDLGRVVVRAKIEVNQITAALTVTTDGNGPFAIPNILDGIPLQIKHVNVLIDRPGFTFNPTNCSPTAITGSISSAEGASSGLSVPFQATNCATLAFKPGFSVSTSGKTSRKTGASLHVKLTYPKAPFGSQANIKSVKVDLPKQLPSRLTTLQKACVDSTFSRDPASCPAASRVGMAKAITPLVPVPLEGPAYFVSHGGAKFPELIVVLQGYGVTIDLHGETFIDKEGVTSSTFRTVPDAPVGSFELTLPQGPDSALAANGNLCKSTLKMPTAFTAQNGMTIKQSTPISVTGCAKAKKKAKHARKARKRHKTGGRGKR